jgi:inner membrane protein
MDPLTQGLLGASFGQALFGRALGRKALVWGAVVGMAPDLDVVANPVSPMAEWLWHRGPTHALWFGPVVGPVIGWLLWKWKGGRLRDWTWGPWPRGGRPWPRSACRRPISAWGSW